MFRFMKSALLPIDAASIERMFQAMREESPHVVAPEREQVLSAYRGLRRGVVGLGIARDIAFRMPTVWLAAGHGAVAPTWLYRFDHSTPLLRLAGIGAAHAARQRPRRGYGFDADPACGCRACHASSAVA